MNKIVLFFFLFCSISYAQQYRYGVGGNVRNENNEKISADKVRQLLKNNKEALQQFNVGRSKKTWGNVLFYGGISLAAINLVDGVFSSSSSVTSTGQIVERKVTPTLAIIGGTMFLASIPIKLGYTKKVKTAVNALNDPVSYKQNTDPELTIMVNGNGLGCKVTF